MANFDILSNLWFVLVLVLSPGPHHLRLVGAVDPGQDLSVLQSTTEPTSSPVLVISDPSNILRQGANVSLTLASDSSNSTTQHVLGTNGTLIPPATFVNPGTGYSIILANLDDNDTILFTGDLIIRHAYMRDFTVATHSTTDLQLTWSSPTSGAWTELYIAIDDNGRVFIDENNYELKNLSPATTYKVELIMISKYKSEVLETNKTYFVQTDPNKVTRGTLSKIELPEIGKVRITVSWNSPVGDFDQIEMDTTSKATGEFKTYVRFDNMTTSVHFEHKVGDIVTIQLTTVKGFTKSEPAILFARLLPLPPSAMTLVKQADKLYLQVAMPNTYYTGLVIVTTFKSSRKSESKLKTWNSGDVFLYDASPGETYSLSVKTVSVGQMVSSPALAYHTEAPDSPSHFTYYTIEDSLFVTVVMTDSLYDAVQQRCLNCSAPALELDGPIDPEGWFNVTTKVYTSQTLDRAYAFEARSLVKSAVEDPNSNGATTLKSQVYTQTLVHKESPLPVTDISFVYQAKSRLSLQVNWRRPRVLGLQIIRYLISYVGVKKNEISNYSNRNYTINDNYLESEYFYKFSNSLYAGFEYTFTIYTEYENDAFSMNTGVYAMPDIPVKPNKKDTDNNGDGGDDNKLLIIVVCCVVAAFLLLAVVVAALVFIKKRNNKAQMSNSKINGELNDHTQMRQISSVLISNKCNLVDFGEKVAKMGENSQLLYDMEFKTLQYIGELETCNAAQLAVNFDKNRFINVLAYDSSRVHLIPVIPPPSPAPSSIGPASPALSSTSALRSSPAKSLSRDTPTLSSPAQSPKSGHAAIYSSTDEPKQPGDERAGVELDDILVSTASTTVVGAGGGLDDQPNAVSPGLQRRPSLKGDLQLAAPLGGKGGSSSPGIIKRPLEGSNGKTSPRLSPLASRHKTKKHYKPSNDYINANWIPGYNHNREFAVAQGPMAHTIADFWTMCWQTKTCQIVMLTKCLEKGREKCERYWPTNQSETLQCGAYEIQLKSQSVEADWTISVLDLCFEDEHSLIRHYHFTSWPDHGVPENTSSLIGFVRLVRSDIKDTKKSIVVHCSAGVGRSGTFIALDYIFQHIEKYNWVDVYGIVCELRKYRKLMVQTEEQYICIHRCLLQVLIDKGIVAKPVDQIYDNEAYNEDVG